MSNSLRRLAGVVVAMAFAGGIVYLVDSFAMQLHPLPEGIDPTDREALKLALESGAIPFASLGLMASGWLLAAYVGGSLANRVGRWYGSIWLFVIIFVVGVFLNLSSAPHPVWMWVTGIAGCPLFALAAGNQPLKVSA
jgi:hypothetical protein